MARGIGFSIGFTVLGALLLYVLQQHRAGQSAHHRQISGGTGSHCGEQSVIKRFYEQSSVFYMELPFCSASIRPSSMSCASCRKGEPYFALSRPLFELGARDQHRRGVQPFVLKAGDCRSSARGADARFCASIRRVKRRFPRLSRLAISGLIGGGLGNLIDRILFGGVTDYIRLSLIRFPIFNFADICITVSVAALIACLASF